jgi:SNF2 family DNA or RNA helicase
VADAGIVAEQISGDTPLSERTRIFHAFQTDPDLRVLLCHPAVTSHGVTLTAADQIIWHDPTHSYEKYLQANHRFHRPGQTSKHYVVRLIGSELERRVYQRLDNHQSTQNILLEMFKDD